MFTIVQFYERNLLPKKMSLPLYLYKHHKKKDFLILRQQLFWRHTTQISIDQFLCFEFQVLRRDIV